jgi:hypothetical protein
MRFGTACRGKLAYAETAPVAIACERVVSDRRCADERGDRLPVPPLTGFLRFYIFTNVETSNALLALAALAQETRLAVHRLLIEHAPDGLPAGESPSGSRFLRPRSRSI